MSRDLHKTFREMAGVLLSPRLDPRVQAGRISFMEESVMLPIKAIVIGMIFYFLFMAETFRGVSEMGEPPMSLSMSKVQLIFLIYVIVNVIGGAFLLAMKRFSVTSIQWLVFALNLLDIFFLAAVTVVAGGLNNYAYWVFVGLILRNTISVPEPTLQITLNILLIGCYAAASYVDKTIIDDLQYVRPFGIEEPKVEEAKVQPYQPYVLRIFLLTSLAACSYGLQVLFDKQRQVKEDMEELILRQEQLQAAGRLAAEVAHQLKNPLAIINNTAFSLQKALKNGKAEAADQLGIIRDEVDRSDRIITELMGYAQLAEGKVEKLDVGEAITEAVEQVFPTGAHFPVRLERDVESPLPALHMQKQHLRGMLVNLFQNAREASPENGTVRIQARSNGEFNVIITVADEGPGVPPERVERVFEPYFTTKDRGTGLGLAIVKHNAEVYGGKVSVESTLGKGARFVLELPVKTMMRIRK